MRYLRDGLRLVFVLALLIAAGVWVTGPARSAVAIRGALGGSARRFGGEHVHAGPVSAFVARFTGVLRVAILALAGIILIAIDQPTVLDVVILAVVVVLALLIVEVIRVRGALSQLSRLLRRSAVPATEHRSGRERSCISHLGSRRVLRPDRGRVACSERPGTQAVGHDASGDDKGGRGDHLVGVRRGEAVDGDEAEDYRGEPAVGRTTR